MENEQDPYVSFLPICGVCQPNIDYYKGQIIFRFDGTYSLENVEEVAKSVYDAKTLVEYIRDNLQNLIS